jgi:ABC-type transport system involved in cytochrome bd biosynthesis fused ATPase/permease subunit
LLFYYYLIKKKLKTYSNKKFYSEQKSNSKLIDLFSNFVYFKINKKFLDYNLKNIQQQLKVKLNIATKFSLIEIFPSVSIELIIYFILGAFFILIDNNKIYFESLSLENIGLFIFGLLRMSKFFSLFLNNFLSFKSNEKSILTISNLLFDKSNNTTSDKNNKFKINKITKIKIENLVLTYTKGNGKIFYPNFEFKIGNINLVIGKSGSGKTTLVEFLLGIRDARLRNGTIKINNYYLHDINKNELWNKISYVPSNSYIPKTKLIKLIKIINKNISSDEITKKIKFCELNKLINKNNFNKFTIKENQKNISTGQSFRISLFLELLKNTDVMIFDESLSSLDLNTRHQILRKLEKLSHNKIIIIITHDESLISYSYKKLNLNTGN